MSFKLTIFGQIGILVEDYDTVPSENFLGTVRPDCITNCNAEGKPPLTPEDRQRMNDLSFETRSWLGFRAEGSVTVSPTGGIEIGLGIIMQGCETETATITLFLMKPPCWSLFYDCASHSSTLP